MISVIDYEVGNLGSITNSLKRLNLDYVITRDPETILKSQAIILPGVGTFPVAMENLNKFHLVSVLNQAKEKHILILGICLGMQILFEKGNEGEETKGLGFLKGYVDEIKTTEKIPHMGWNELIFNHLNHPLLKYVEEKDYVYFVHSFMAYANNQELDAYCLYGKTKIPALVSKDHVFGCQFHPEKSGQVGEKILLAFKEMIEGC